MDRTRSRVSTIVAIVFALFVTLAGYFYLGPLVAGIFLLGYGGGLAWWLSHQPSVDFSQIRVPYWLALAAFVLHKVEENRTAFFETLSRQVTGVPVPETTPALFFSLLVVPVGAWLLIPWAMKRHVLGTFLAYTFFASMVFSELAHFVFPLLAGGRYGYFPGMATVLLLAPLGSWGLWRLMSAR